MQTVEFKHKFHELVHNDSLASGQPFPDYRSNPDFTPSHQSTPREGSAISGLAPLPLHNLSGASALDHLLSSRASEPAELFGGDETHRDPAEQVRTPPPRCAIVPQYKEQLRIVLSILKVSVPTTCPIAHPCHPNPTLSRCSH